MQFIGDIFIYNPFFDLEYRFTPLFNRKSPFMQAVWQAILQPVFFFI